MFFLGWKLRKINLRRLSTETYQVEADTHNLIIANGHLRSTAFTEISFEHSHFNAAFHILVSKTMMQWPGIKTFIAHPFAGGPLVFGKQTLPKSYFDPRYDHWLTRLLTQHLEKTIASV